MFTAVPGSDYGHGNGSSGGTGLESGDLTVQVKDPETQNWVGDTGRTNTLNNNMYNVYHRRLDQLVGQTQKRF